VLASTILGLALAAASTYCTGQPVSDSSGPLYPNGQRAVDGAARSTTRMAPAS
jgi:hypothetical protein